MIAAIVLALAAATPAPPTYVVERVVTQGQSSTRVSVFRNGVAVLARGGPGTTPSVVRQPLTDVELRVIEQVVAECYPDLARFAGMGEAPVAGCVELRLAPADREALVVRFPVSAAPGFAASRLTQALDALERRLAKTAVTREDLRGWEPKVGERVELEDGRVVEIVDVMSAGDKVVVQAQVGDGPASIFVSADDLRRMAVRRVTK
ncbi:MAG TPA: hypothetical protein VMT19_11455 [Thermoanaerobaculaceae bacterium]|nr:hypothetical protein [Thermoanaerobaculaceae bacterium]